MSKVLKTIVNVILFCAIVVAAGLLIPPFAGITTVMVDDVDMQTNLPQGSVAYAVEKDRSELKQGDKVLISQEGRQYVYVVDSIDGSSVVLDDQLSTDGGTTQQELGSTVQKVMLVVPVIGYVSMALRSTEGLIIVGLAVVFVIILFILAEVWKKDDDEEEDEENEDAQEDESEEEQEEEPAVMSRRQKKKARKADKKKQKQEEKAAVAEAKARAKRERQEAKLAKKNKKAHMMDESEQEAGSDTCRADGRDTGSRQHTGNRSSTGTDAGRTERRKHTGNRITNGRNSGKTGIDRRNGRSG